MKPADNPSEQPEIRKHYFLDESVIIAPSRQHSLHDSLPPIEPPNKPHPILEDQSVYELADPNHPGQWAVKSVLNKYPAFGEEYERAHGQHEVLLETPATDILFPDLSVKQIDNILQAYQERCSALKALPRINYVSIFKNHGYEAGGSMKHPHSQIIASELIPPRLHRWAELFTQLQSETGGSPTLQAVEWERSEGGQRVIAEDHHLVAITPYASRFPFEVWLVPLRQVHSVCELSIAERYSLAMMLRRVTSTLHKNNIPFNFFLSEGILGYQHHFIIEVTPRPNIWAGYEMATNMIINPASPEYAAEWYQMNMPAG